MAHWLTDCFAPPAAPGLAPGTPAVAMMRQGQLLVGRDPLASWVLRRVEDLHALPAQLARAQADHPGLQACGLLAYDAGLALHGLTPDDGTGACRESGANGDTPLAVVHLFSPGTVTRHTPGQAGAALPAQQPFLLRHGFRAELPGDDYRQRIAAIHAYEKAGDCYQVNFAQRLCSRYRGDPLDGFRQLLKAHPAPWSSFFRWQPDQAVFGVSPECFLRTRGDTIVSEPIKGSRPRGDSATADQRLADELTGSGKDRAENLMIVDLLRNDLGQVCVPGSITAEPLFELRRFSNVQHLVSTIRGSLRAGCLPLQALLSAFPGGSITGAPKKRAMQIIQELEPVARGFYCGSQFWLDDRGDLDANILIRSFQCRGEAIVCHGGGGIVVDSDADTEHAESLFKVEKLMQALDCAPQAD
jgi:para-aminobenzoate synthetase component 1